MIIGREKQLQTAFRWINDSLISNKLAHVAVFGPTGCGRTVFLKELAEYLKNPQNIILFGELNENTTDAVIDSLLNSIEMELCNDFKQYVSHHKHQPLVLAKMAEKVRDEFQKNTLIFVDMAKTVGQAQDIQNLREFATWLRILINWLVDNPVPLILILGCPPIVLESRLTQDVSDVFRDRLPRRIWLGNHFDNGCLDAFAKIVDLQLNIHMPEQARAIERLENLTVSKLLELLKDCPVGPLTLNDLWIKLCNAKIITFPPQNLNIDKKLSNLVDWPYIMLTDDGIKPTEELKTLVRTGIFRENISQNLVPTEKLYRSVGFSPPEFEPNLEDIVEIRLGDNEDQNIAKDILIGCASFVKDNIAESPKTVFWNSHSGYMKIILNRVPELLKNHVKPELLPREIFIILLLKNPGEEMLNLWEELKNQGKWVIILEGLCENSYRTTAEFRSRFSKESDYSILFSKLEINLTNEECKTILMTGITGRVPESDRIESIMQKVFIRPLNELLKERPLLDLTSSSVTNIYKYLIDKQHPLSKHEISESLEIRLNIVETIVKELISANILCKFKTNQQTIEWLPDEDKLLSLLLSYQSDKNLINEIEKQWTIPYGEEENLKKRLANIFKSLASYDNPDKLNQAIIKWKMISIRGRYFSLHSNIKKAKVSFLNDLLTNIGEIEKKILYYWEIAPDGQYEFRGNLAEQLEELFIHVRDLEEQFSKVKRQQEERIKALKLERDTRLVGLKSLWEKARVHFSKEEQNEYLKGFNSLNEEIENVDIIRKIDQLEEKLNKRREYFEKIEEKLKSSENKKKKLSDKLSREPELNSQLQILIDAAHSQIREKDISSLSETLNKFDNIYEQASDQIARTEMELSIPKKTRITEPSEVRELGGMNSTVYKSKLPKKQFEDDSDCVSNSSSVIEQKHETLIWQQTNTHLQKIDNLAELLLIPELSIIDVEVKVEDVPI